MNTAVSPETLPQIVWQHQKVITTELLAQCYGTDIANIRQNHSRNPTRFEEGKHYFKLEGEQLKAFKNRVTESHSVTAKNDDLAEQLDTLFKQSGMDQVFGNVHIIQAEKSNDSRVDNIDFVGIGAKTKSLMLWTEKGAVRHAKILDTDKAWDVQERLEDAYFHPERKTSGYLAPNSETKQLIDAKNQLIESKDKLIDSQEHRLAAQESSHQAYKDKATAYINHLSAQISQQNGMIAHHREMTKRHREELAQAVRAQRPMGAAEEEEIVSLYEQGTQVRILAMRFYRSPALIRRAIRNQGGVL